MGYRWQSGQLVCLRSGRSGRLGETSANPAFSVYQIRRSQPASRSMPWALLTAQIGYASNASLFLSERRRRERQGIALTCGAQQPASTLLRQAQVDGGGAAGIGWGVRLLAELDGPVIEYDHLFMGDANNSFSVANTPCLPVQPTGSARTWIWSPFRFKLQTGAVTGASAHY